LLKVLDQKLHQLVVAVEHFLPAVRLSLCLDALKVGQPTGPVPVSYPAVRVQKSDLDADRV